MKVYSVYRHINRFNNCVYVGVTTQKPEYRWRGGKGYMNNELFFNEILFYGWDNFTHEILAKTTKKETANLLESTYIEIYQKLGLSYNLESGGYSGFKIADSTRQKRSENHWDCSGSNNPMYGKLGADNPSSKKVVQLDKTDGHIIKVWNSIIDVERELGIDHSNIIKACKGKLKSANGYKWQYLEEEDEDELNNVA